MIQVAVIGLGNFGYKLAVTLHDFGADVIAIDKDEKIIDSIKDNVSQAVRLDASDENALRDIGISEIDAGVVAIGSNIEENIIVTTLLRRMGVTRIVSRAMSNLHEKILDEVGASKIVRIEEPKNAMQALDQMVEHVKSILNALELPYRILRLCGGDIGFTSALTYDFEIYSTAQERWLEISSVSTFNSFQAERLQLRYKDKTGNKQNVHTLNGSSLALPRVVAGLLENCQTPEGIMIPKALVPYTGFDRIN